MHFEQISWPQALVPMASMGQPSPAKSRRGGSSQAKPPANSRRTSAEFFNATVKTLGDCPSDDLMRMVEGLNGNFNRYKTLHKTRDDLFAVIWKGTNMLPSTPIIERAKVLQIQLMCLEHRSLGFPLLQETIESCVQKASQHFGLSKPDLLASIIQRPDGLCELRGSMSSAVLPQSSTGHPWQLGQDGSNNKWFVSDGAQSFYVEDVLDEFKRQPQQPQAACLYQI